MTPIAEFLQPIHADLPAGADVRLLGGDLTLERLAEQRRESGPEGALAGPGKLADWPAVVRECEAFLKQRGKDLQVAAWLADAWARSRGPAGLRDGLELIGALCERFWDALHPGAGQAGAAVDLEQRGRWLAWLASERGLLAGVSACPLLHGERGALSGASRELAELVDRQANRADRSRHQELLDAGLFGSEEWNARLRAAGPAPLAELGAQLAQCEAALEALRRDAARRFAGSAAAPELGPLAARLEQLRALVPAAPPAASALALAAASDCAAQRVPALGSPPAAALSAAPAAIAGREQALRLLAELGAYFARSEPHSPLVPLIERAVRWGSLSFEQVLREVVRSEEALARAWETLGIEPSRQQY